MNGNIQDSIFSDAVLNYYKKPTVLSFVDLLNKVRNHMLEVHGSLIENANESELIKTIKLFLIKSNISCDQYDEVSLIKKLIDEISNYSFLTEYLSDNEIEEININSWDDVSFLYSNGDVIKSKEHFLSKEHAVDIIRKLLRNSKMVFDYSRPIVRGHLSKNIRITCFGPPVIDDDIGISASIRKINHKKLDTADFIESGTATKEMLSLLNVFLNYGVSVVCSGATGTGKTTMMSYILNNIEKDKRIITIENEVREFNIKESHPNVLHLIAKTFEDKSKNITQEKLLEYSLTSNPDVIAISESKSGEAFQAQEAARTGHSVITTVHANSCEETYLRLLTLCMLNTDIKEDLLYKLITDAFPIVFYMKKIGSKRIIYEMSECVKDDQNIRINTLYKYENNSFVKKNNLSDTLRKKLQHNGFNLEELCF